MFKINIYRDHFSNNYYYIFLLEIVYLYVLHPLAI